jgi:hypothetical protein
MKTTTMTKASLRNADLRRMLQDRQRETRDEVESRIHEVRVDGPDPVLDEGEHAAADVQSDIELRWDRRASSRIKSTIAIPVSGSAFLKMSTVISIS